MNKSRRIFYLLSPALILALILAVTPLALAEGNGTADDPYIIANGEQLYSVRNDLGAYYRLKSDIDLSDFLADKKTGWQPIGTSSPKAPFTGNFDGNGYKITGLWIDNSGKRHMGLFGYTDGAVIKDLGLELAAAGIKGGGETGGLAGRQDGGSIKNCYVTGSISGGIYTGGLVGMQAKSCNIEGCYVRGSVSGKDNTGGLVGRQDGGIIETCYVIGSVSGDNSTGGITGDQTNIDEQEGGRIENCYTGCSVNGKNYSGGLVGIQGGSGSIANCYATGNVKALDENSKTGGLVGLAQNSEINNCYAAGNVEGFEDIGGLVGRASGSGTKIENSFALNATVEGTANVGRVVGNHAGGSLNGNYALECMLVNNAVVPASDS
ncbi:MAG: hypothetical protein FWG06_02740, partial [Clostridiales bacterium]|nr:hypothetical protein [Clostridiales bacterium]